MGGRAGRGWKRICWPFTSTTSSAKHRWSTSSDSSVIFPRRFESRPSARNSSSIQPVPTPSRIRPPDKSCTVASHLAVGKAGLKGRFKTPVPSPIRWVAAAKKANVAKGSRVRIAPSTSVLGTPARAPGGKVRRSLIHTVSSPDSSTARANSRISSLVLYGPQLRRLMLSFTPNRSASRLDARVQDGRARSKT